MPEREPYKKVEPIGFEESRKVERTPADADSGGPSKVKFEEAVQKADTSKIELRRPIEAAHEKVVESTQKQSLLDLASAKVAEKPQVAPVPKDIEQQATSLREALERPRATLYDNQNLIVDASAVSALSANVEHIDRALQDALHLTTNVEVGSAIPAPTTKPPLERFLNFLTESDRRLSGIISEVQGLQLEKQRLTPATLLAMQVKIGFIQQELEFFTTTLNKALESTKTIMNVQI